MQDKIFNTKYDVYIAYDSKDQSYVNKIKRHLCAAKSGVKIFVETQKFEENLVWQEKIFENMVSSKRYVPVWCAVN